MKRRNLIIITSILFGSLASAQGGSKSIDNQFNTLINKSTNYQTYKVIDKQELQNLQQNVADTISKYKSSLTANSSLNAQNKETVDALTQKLQTAEQSLKALTAKEEHFEVFGLSMQKELFQIILIALFSVLLLLIGIFYYRFKNSHTTTKDAIKNLKETEEEFEEHRRAALEREQKIKRQLQDEINKNKVVEPKPAI